MRTKPQINQRDIQKVCHCIMAFFIPFTSFYSPLCQFYSITFPALLKRTNYGMKKKRFFVYMTTSTYHIISKEVENCIFRHTCICKQPILTKYWNYYSFVFTVGSLYLELASDQQICLRYRKLPQKSKFLLIKQERLTKVY